MSECRAMTAKEYLSQIRLLDKKIDQRIDEKNSLLAIATGTGPCAANSGKVQSSISGSKIAQAMDRYIDLESEINQMIDQFVALRHKIIDEIQSLPDHRYVELLYLRYVKYKRIEEIDCIMKKTDGSPYSYDHIFRLHGQALESFRKCHSNAR